ncbi:hypothetical protein OROHE_012605 [Orobanche hederae]
MSCDQNVNILRVAATSIFIRSKRGTFIVDLVLLQEDVIESLSLQKPLVLKSSFNRPNIYYEVRYKDLMDDPYSDLCNYLKSCGNVCAIVYCLERTGCDDLALHLSAKGITCAAYHAGLNSKLQCSVLDDWISSRTQIVVATVVFGMLMTVEKWNSSWVRPQTRNHNLQAWRRVPPKSLAEFQKMVEYCEGTGCRRKRSLKVTTSLCGKTCDSCKHPDMVSKYLEELTSTAAFRYKNSYGDEQLSEFWNQNDEASGSEEEISDSDVANKVYKNSISATLRDSRKQRLQNAMKQSQHLSSTSNIDFVKSAETLEIECYKKYEKSGKSFYLSQMASFARWLSGATADELIERLGNTTVMSPEAVKPEVDCSFSPSPSFIPASTITPFCQEKGSGSVESDSAAPVETMALLILSF